MCESAATFEAQTRTVVFNGEAVSVNVPALTFVLAADGLYVFERPAEMANVGTAGLACLDVEGLTLAEAIDNFWQTEFRT